MFNHIIFIVKIHQIFQIHINLICISLSVIKENSIILFIIFKIPFNILVYKIYNSFNYLYLHYTNELIELALYFSVSQPV